ncbi:MAG: glycosyltransferase family 4 protein [Planctomycetes bacterium]|nr:glycosyltransferase family 4 protein [Planctomycetota bacterium]
MNLHVAVAGWLLGPPSGANRRLLRLVREAAAQLAPGERITVLHGHGFAAPADDGVRWHPIDVPAAPTLARANAERRELGAALALLGATVYDHGFLPLPRAPVPTCLLVHDTRAVAGLSRWPRWFARAVLRRSLRRADAVVAPSQWTAGELTRLVPGLQPIVVPNGVDLPPPGATPPAPRRPLPPHGYLLHTGHLEPRKNLGVVVRALAALPEDRRPELWLVGRDAGSGQALVRAPFVRWFGAVDDDELPALYAHARAIVVPSRLEGFGLCALEGLAHGRPVLASDRTALPEVLGGLGTLLPPDDVAGWATAIAALPPPGSEDGAAAARRARAGRFAWPAAAAQQLAVWRRLHAQRRAGFTAPGG